MRFGKFFRRFIVYPGICCGGVLVYDQYTSQRIIRNVRANWVMFRLIYEYKFNWDDNDLNSDLHRRCATIILDLCRKNGGLYVKFGQGIASMNHILPKEYNEVFQVLHDKAPSVEYKDIKQIILDDLKVDPNVIFKEFDKKPIASASIAQVHKARLHSGEEVAVKIQKPYIQAQVPWDLFCYRILLHIVQYAFDLPLVWSAEFTEQQMLKETDFIEEAMNSQKTQQLLNENINIFDYPSKFQREYNTDFIKRNEIYFNKYIKNDYLKKHIHVPKLYPQYCSKRILTAEWCDGVKVNDIVSIKKMGYNFSDIMHAVVSLFGYQIFVSGLLHCDPHPGNLLVRNHPKIKNDFEIVFLDHGLYIEEPIKFREEYSQFWQSMFVFDVETLKSLSKNWGVRDVDFFASMQLIKPFSINKGGLVKKKLNRGDIARLHQKAKDKAKFVLNNTKLIPRHIVFVGRNMNLVRANNKDLGSPVNRVNILASYAAQGNTLNNSYYNYYKYKWVMFKISMYYQWTMAYNWLTNNTSKHFEEKIDDSMKLMAQKMGFAVDEDMFEA